MALISTLAIPALLGLIPANIAKNKGRSFGLWWFYGFMLFIVALPHSILMQDLSGATKNYSPQFSFDDGANSSAGSQPPGNSVSSEPSQEDFDHIIKYKELLAAGVITQDEFDAKRKELLGS